MKNIKFIGKSVYIESENILVISDLHFGFEESLNQQGVFIPRIQFKEVMREMQDILSKIKPEKIIILGDLKHVFGNILMQEWQETVKFIDYLSENCKEVIILKGNHDKILGPIASKRDIDIREFYSEGKYFFCHGDKKFNDMLNKDIEYIVMGHLHPTVTLRDKAKVEKYKCFLVGKYKNKTLVILPSFIPLTVGADLMLYGLKPFDDIDLDDFEVYDVEDEVYEIGKYKEFH